MNTVFITSTLQQEASTTALHILHAKQELIHALSEQVQGNIADAVSSAMMLENLEREEIKAIRAAYLALQANCVYDEMEE